MSYDAFTSLICRLEPQLEGLGSVLVVSNTKETTANTHTTHPTLSEFLLGSIRGKDHYLAVDPHHQHTQLLSACLEVLQGLKRDICNIRDPSLLNSDVPDLDKRVRSAIPWYLKYACRHWCAHLLGGELLDEILDALLEFAQERLLHWVEACSLLGVLIEAISGLNKSQRK
ncbi:uncharacterized protein PHACADRAFT_214067, partial [Phanerochaete carnosa HHB-10118-sp]